MARLYVQLDVDYADDPKIIRAGEKAELLYLRGLALAKRLLTDGFISDDQLPRFMLSDISRRVDKLVSVGLWEPVKGGYVISAWLKRNPAAAEVAAAEEQARLDGIRGNHNRWHKDRRSEACPLCQPESGADPPPDTDPNRVPDRGAESSESETKTESSSARPDQEPEPARTSVDDDDVWKQVAQRRLKRERGEIRNRGGWLNTTAKNAKLELQTEAKRLLDRYPDLSSYELAARLDGDALPIRYRGFAS
jgi:hypothetical protein